MVKIKVIRILCIGNLEKRIRTGELLQYTITILPAFLIPHSRIPVSAVFNAIDYYITRKSNQFEAAQILYCESNHSFALFFKRIGAHIDDWNNLLSKETDDNFDISFCEKWSRIIPVMKDFASPNYTEFWCEYSHSHFCQNKMGLGP